MFLPLCGFILFAGLGNGGAQAAWPKTDADFALLPAYCKARMQNPKSAEYKMWNQRLPGGFLHVHHYCAGLYTTYLANRITDRQKIRQVLRQVVDEFEYVEKHASQNFILMPEVLVKKGRALERLDRDGEAVNAYRKSIRLNRKYAPAYMALSDFYRSKENLQEARKIAEEGLKQAPSSKGLNRRVKEMEKKNVK